MAIRLTDQGIRSLACVFVICLACFGSAILGLASCQKAQDKMQRANNESLNEEQLAVYRAVLQPWIEGGIYLSTETTPQETGNTPGVSDCVKGLDLEPADPALVHSFRAQDLPQLGAQAGAGIQLQDFREAERSNFRVRLVLLSEIRFNKSHNFALVRYGFRSGLRFSQGETLLMEKRFGAWQRGKTCSGWIT